MNTTVPLIHEKKDRWASCFDPNIDPRERGRGSLTQRGQRIGLLFGLALVVLGVFVLPLIALAVVTAINALASLM